jgi:hypothetical protein
MAAVAGVERAGDGTLIVRTTDCMWCARPGELRGVNAEGFERWRAGALIQNALPELSESERELLMSGSHAECWPKICGPDDEDE